MSITPTNCLADHDGWTESTVSVCKACWDNLQAQLAAVEKERDRLANGLTVEKGWSEAFREDAAKLLTDNDVLGARVAQLEGEREEAVLNSAPAPDCESCADARPRECYSCIEVLVKNAREEGRAESKAHVAQLGADLALAKEDALSSEFDMHVLQTAQQRVAQLEGALGKVVIIAHDYRIYDIEVVAKAGLGGKEGK